MIPEECSRKGAIKELNKILSINEIVLFGEVNIVYIY